MKQLFEFSQDISLLERIGFFSKEDLEKWIKIKKAQQFCHFLLDNDINYDFCVKHSEVRSCLESTDYYKRFSSYLVNDYIVCKNLLLQERNGEKKYLLITSSDKKVDLAGVKNNLGSKKLEFVQEAEMQRLIDATPGNVSIFSIINDLCGEVMLVIDEDLLLAKDLVFHPLYNGMSIFISPKECFKFLNLIERDTIILTIAEKEIEKNIQKSLVQKI